MRQNPLQAACDRPRDPLDLGELFGHVVDEDAREESHLVGVEVVATLPLVEFGEELRQLGGEALVEVEDSAYRVGQVVAAGAVEPRLAVRPQPLQGAVQVAQATRLHVADLVGPGEHPLDEFVHLLAGTRDQVAVAPPVVVVEARRVADRRRHREVPPTPQALQPVRDHSRIDPRGAARDLSRHVVRRELGEERPGEDTEDGPVLVPLLTAEITEQQPGTRRIGCLCRRGLGLDRRRCRRGRGLGPSPVPLRWPAAAPFAA